MFVYNASEVSNVQQSTDISSVNETLILYTQYYDSVAQILCGDTNMKFVIQYCRI